MIRQISSPAPVPYQTYNVSVLLGFGIARRISYLFDELLVYSNISTWAIEGLLQESQENRDNDCCLQCLSEDNEKDRHGENVDRHDCGFIYSKEDKVDEEVEVDSQNFQATRALKSKGVVATFLGTGSLLSLGGSDYATGSD